MTSRFWTARETGDILLLAETMAFLLSWHVSTLNAKNIPFRMIQVKHDCFFLMCTRWTRWEKCNSNCLVLGCIYKERFLCRICSRDRDIKCQTSSSQLCSVLEKASTFLQPGQRKAVCSRALYPPASLSYTAVSLFSPILLVVLNRFKGSLVLGEGEHLPLNIKLHHHHRKEGRCRWRRKKSRVTNLMYLVRIAATVNTPTVRSQIIPTWEVSQNE